MDVLLSYGSDGEREDDDEVPVRTGLISANLRQVWTRRRCFLLALRQLLIGCGILVQETGLESGGPVHKGDVDEGIIRWEPPAFSGLDNSQGFRDLMKGCCVKPKFVLSELEIQLWAELAKMSEVDAADWREAPLLSDNLVKHLFGEMLNNLNLRTAGSFDAINQLVNHGYLPYEYANVTW